MIYSTFTMQELIQWIPNAIRLYAKHRMASFILMYLQFLQLVNDQAWPVNDLESAMRVAFLINDPPSIPLKDSLNAIVSRRDVF